MNFRRSSGVVKRTLAIYICIQPPYGKTFKVSVVVLETYTGGRTSSMYRNGDIALRRHHYWQAMKYMGGSATVEACSCSANQNISRLYLTRRNIFTRNFLLSLSLDTWIHYTFLFLSDILLFRLRIGLTAGFQLRFF
jgi:hypothetical protein